VPVLGRVPQGAGALSPTEFTRDAAQWFHDDLFDALR
jgi:hypothetical protein